MREANVVWVDFSEGFYRCDSLDGLDFGCGDVLLFVLWSLGLSLLGGYGDDKIFAGLNFFEVLFGLCEFEGFGPIELFISLGPHLLD